MFLDSTTLSAIIVFKNGTMFPQKSPQVRTIITY
jgi:hypothetical protein